MKTSTIYAEKAVSSSEARKHFKDCLSGEPVVVLSNNEPAGYMMSARLDVIAHLNAQALAELNESDLGEFQE